MDDPRRNQNNADPEPRGNSSAWVVVIIIVIAIIGISLLLQIGNDRTLQYRQLLELLEKTKFDSSGKLIDPDLAVMRVAKPGAESMFFEYRGPNQLKIGDRQITGKVEFRIVDDKSAEASKDFETIDFACLKSPIPSFSDPLQGLMDNANVEYGYEKPALFNQWAPFLIPMLIIVGLFYFMMRRLGGAGGPMQFGRSRGKLMADDDLAVMFSDVAGIDEAVEEVKEVVDFLQQPEKYQRLGGKIPRGVLLVGPPGTGKTLLAKAIAGEAGVPFFSLSGSDFVEMFVGVGAARVRDMFQQAEAKAPCIIFIDELDALGKSRGGSAVGGHDEREQTLNALLVEMDGFATNSGVIVMAATNRPETLDSALMRPGRFDRHVLVDRPDVKGREAILKVHVKNVKLDADVDLKQVAAISPGFAGAELANLVNEAALLAARGDCSTVQMKHFNEGVERVTAGLEKKQRVMNQDEKERVAYHESGHALVAFSLPNTDPVHKVSIIPRGVAALGYMMQRPADDRYLVTQSELESQLQVLLAGTLAEELIYQDISTGASNDLERATDIARGMVMRFGMSPLGRVNYKQDRGSAFLPGAAGEASLRQYSEETAQRIDAEVKQILDRTVKKVRDILQERKKALLALTTRLIEVESIDAVELKRIIDDNSPGPLLVPGTDARQGDEDSETDATNDDASSTGS